LGFRHKAPVHLDRRRFSSKLPGRHLLKEEKMPMTPQQRRAAGRRRAWGRGPIILRFERLESRQLLTAATPTATPAQALPDLVGADFATPHDLNWGDTFQAIGTILNQGHAPATSPFNVAVYASTGTTISTDSVPLGTITIPAGLAPGGTSSFNQTFSLPATPIPNYDSSSPIYIDLFINGNKAVTESNYKNNEGVGQGFDSSPIVIVPEQPSLLLGSSLGVSPTSLTWGQTVTVTAQIRNNAQGDAPPSRAKIVLTPSGLNEGSAYDFTIGYINVPAIPAWQTVNVQTQITLPAAAPSSLASATQFSLALVQDADYVTDPIYPHVASQGVGLDSTPITITASTSATSASSTSSTATPSATPTYVLPNVAPSNVVVTSKAVYWGYNFQVSATFQNLGQAGAPPIEAMYLLTGTGGTLANGVFLGEVTLPALAPGATQILNQTVHLPSVLPNGVTIPSTSTGRIAVLVDPDHAIDQTLRSNALAESAPLTLRVLGTDGSSTVPTSPPIGTTLGQPQPAGSIQSTSTTTPAPAVAASPQAKAARQGHTLKLHRQVKPKRQSITARIEHQLRVFPSNVQNFFNSVIGNSTKPKPKKKAKG
jgi:hypothetical protein